MENAQNGEIIGVGQIHISAKDFDRALRFYRDTLGLKLLFAVPDQQMAFFDCGGVRIYMGVPVKPEYSANSFLYYRVENIDEAHRKLEARGVEFLHPPGMVHKDQNAELWTAGFRDSEGNLAQLMCEKPVAN